MTLTSIRTSISSLRNAINAVTQSLLATYAKVVSVVLYLKSKAQPYLDLL